MSAITIVIEFLADEYFPKFSRYLSRKKVELIEKKIDDEMYKEDLKRWGKAPRCNEYYLHILPLKIMEILWLIVSGPFIFWSQITQVFKPFYKKVFE